ncbi:MULTISPECIES: TonB-dependent receptor [unclassified Acidovorax]|uniref:TonB-dependent receptor n=1 Tax=unclassified Acidovorax TaxID=2684926 RepID=UPI00288337ED|nr:MULTISPECIES: TonB-dependent receptor [unclassified Acidovorax]
MKSSTAAICRTFNLSATAWGLAICMTSSMTAAQPLDGGTLPPMTVNARGHEEAVQSVPVPVTVIGEREIDTLRMQRLDDLAQQLPSTNIATPDARRLTIAVRGIGLNPSNDGLEGSTGVYLDNVYLGRAGMAAFDLLDVERVDLLRGPQGTLFGKNTTAGVLSVHTKPPTFERERSVRLSTGERGLRQAQAILSGPLAEDAAGRLLVYDSHDPGVITNLYNGEKLGGSDRSGVRAQLLVRQGAGFDLRLIGEHHRERGSSGTAVTYGLGPGLAVARAIAGGATGIVTDPRRREINVDGEESVRSDQNALSAQARWRLASGAEITSITAARDWRFTRITNDSLNIPVLVEGGSALQQQQISQELRLAGPSGGPISYVVGTYLLRQRTRNAGWTDFGPRADIVLQGTPTPVFANAYSINHGSLDTQSYALFSQATWHSTDRLDITAGLRVTEEVKKARIHRGDSIGGSSATAVLRNNPLVLGAYDTGPLRTRQFSPSGLLSASYQLEPALLGYVSLSHGEKSGGINLAGPGAAPGPLGVDSLMVGPERVNSLDIGFKGRFQEDRLHVNLNFFAAMVNGYQTAYLVPSGAGVGNYVQILTNAGDVRSRGIELELKGRPSRGLTLWSNGSFNDARYLGYENAPCPPEAAIAQPAARCSLSGRQVAGAPRWMFRAGGEYRYRWSPSVTHAVAAAYAWQSGKDGTLDASTYSRVPSYGVFNVATSWDLVQGRQLWNLSLWVRNALDKRYFQAVTATANGAYVASLGSPRTWGLTVKVDY